MLHLFKQLKQLGVLGINQRNAGYVLHYNKRTQFPLVDNKLITKQLAIQANIAIPKLYAVIETPHDIQQLPELFTQYHDFAIKPAYGVGGDGIIVITDRIDSLFRKTNGSLLTLNDLSYHIANILSGMHSLGGQPDKAIIEYRVKVDPVFAGISYQGVPDIRIITLRGYPVMGMVRLPTRMSDGKANLHQGAIGVGIDLATGTTLGGVWHNDAVNMHPDTMQAIAGCQLPYWDDILTLAAQCYELTDHLGYLGVDIVLDLEHGPLILELNARPGLNIQIANRAGLGKRLATVEKHLQKIDNKPEPIATRVQFSKTMFQVQEKTT